MPVLDGFEATRRIMETDPIPIVIVSASLDPQEVTATFRAVEAGALAFLEKPVGAGHPRYADLTKSLVQTVRLMSEVKVVRRRRFSPRPTLAAAPAVEKSWNERGGLVAIGASTGGPQVIQTILARLAPNLAGAGSHRATYFPRFYPGVCRLVGKNHQLSRQIGGAGRKTITRTGLRGSRWLSFRGGCRWSSQAQ